MSLSTRVSSSWCFSANGSHIRHVCENYRKDCNCIGWPTHSGVLWIPRASKSHSCKRRKWIWIQIICNVLINCSSTCRIKPYVCPIYAPWLKRPAGWPFWMTPAARFDSIQRTSRKARKFPPLCTRTQCAEKQRKPPFGGHPADSSQSNTRNWDSQWHCP